jgi:hypothetical protein
VLFELRLFIFRENTYQFKASVNDDNYDACKTVNIKISGGQNLAKWVLTCYCGSTHEHLSSESSRQYLMYNLFLYVLLLCIGEQIITVSISYLVSGRENMML